MPIFGNFGPVEIIFLLILAPFFYAAYRLIRAIIRRLERDDH